MSSPIDNKNMFSDLQMVVATLPFNTIVKILDHEIEIDYLPDFEEFGDPYDIVDEDDIDEDDRESPEDREYRLRERLQAFLEYDFKHDCCNVVETVRKFKCTKIEKSK